MKAGDLLRTAREAARLSQRAFAARSGVAQPSIAAVEGGSKDATVDRVSHLLADLSFRIAPIPSPRPAAWEVACDLRARLSGGDEPGAFREIIQFNDDLAASSPDIRVALCVTPPASTGSRVYDALVAAVVDYQLSRDGLPLPSWLDQETRSTVDEPWDAEPVPALRAKARETTPPAFARRGVFVSEDELVSA